MANHKLALNTHNTNDVNKQHIQQEETKQQHN